MILSKKIRKGVGLVVAALLLGQAGLATAAPAAEPLPPDVSVVELAKPAVVQVRAGATATFRFSDRAWPVAVGGTASGFIVNADGAVVTSSRIIELLQKDEGAIRNALAERFFNEVQKQVGHRLTETERLGVAENTTLIEEVKLYKQVVLSDGQAVDFDIKWTGSPPPEALTTSTPVYSSRPVPHIQRPVTGEGVENLGEGVSPVITEPVTVKEPLQTPEPIIPLSANKEFDPVQELAVLTISINNLPALPLMAADKDDVGQRATVIGYAGNADATALLAPTNLMNVTVTSGNVTATKSGKMKADYGPLLDIESTIGPAGAGGPVITDKGEIIGIAGRTARAIGVYPVINTQAVLAALGKSGLSNASEPSEATRIYASALDMFSQGYMTKTIGILEDLLKLCPHHGPAKALMAEARQRKEAGDDNIYWPDMALYGGITLALIAAGGGYLGLRYRKLGPAAFPALSRSIGAWGAKKRSDRGPEGDGSAAEPAPPPPSVVGQTASLRQTAKAESRPVIEFILGPLTGRRMIIPREGLLVGRDPATCQVVLDDPFISKQHLFVGPDPLDKTAIIVTDKGSTNGTFLESPDGERLVGTRTLQKGDQVYLGQRNAFVLRFE
ncbi:trypsin-like peptidase domain-containing protein [Heliomicrobium modesticaldum]|nr:trypsin-like peptidase domain-containing protein [Heliomicrobium modesticaldum]